MRKLRLLILSILLISFADIMAQTLTDGPIQLQVRTRRINTTFNATDEGVFGIGFRPDELTYNMWARDNADLDGAGWQGGACLQANFNPPALSPDFNFLMLNYTYPTVNVPQFFDIRLNAWEDDRNSDAAIGLTCGGTRCAYNGNACCGVVIFGACVGFTESDDVPCFSDPFRNQMNYRLGPPCQWFNHGFVTYNGSGCANNVYQPEIESYWRYTRGTSCAVPITLGALTAGVGLSHFNSNVCYSNNFAASPGNDVFYSFTIAQPTRIIASVCGASGAQFDSYVYVLNSACTSLAGNDNGCGNQSTVTTKLCSPGTYYVVVDGATAPAQGTFTLSIQIDPSYNFSTTINRTNVTCNGAANGTATAVPTGGTTPYTYLWSNGGNTATINNLAPGNYTVTVTDADGCTSTATTNVTQPTALTATISGTNVTCSGANDGTATVTPSGGTPGYTYRWNSVPIQTTATAIFLQPTNYTVTVTDANNCTLTRNINLTTNSTINLSLNNLQNVLCNGQNNGTIDINVSGGFSPYTYTWSNAAISQDLTGLSPGNYSVTVRDNSLCSVTATYTIIQPPVLSASVNNVVNAFCNGSSDGSITINVLGGVQPYTYLWSNGAVSQNLIDVVAGNYSITVRDANNCSVSTTATITQPTPLAASVTAVNPTCNGLSNGSIAITFSGGTPNYTYLWNTGALTSSINNIPAGNYSVLITDVNGCFRNINTTLTQPQPLSIQSNFTNILCNGLNNGTINLNVSGGTPNYTYSWSNGLPSTANQSNLSAGNYTVTLRDANNCSATQSFNIVEATALNATIASATNISCNGYADGSIQVNVTGGTPPYAYLWSNGAATQSLVNVVAGSYTLTVTDANNCTTTLNRTLTEPAGVNITVNTITDVSCNGFFDGSITLNVSGGAIPYSFLWSNGVLTQNLTNIGAGTYVLLLTDNNNCVQSFTATVAELQPVVANAVITNILCNGNTTGSINVNVSGGTNPTYSYQWGGGQVSEDLNNIIAGNYTQTVTDGNGCSVVNNYTVTEPSVLNAVVSNTTNVTCNGLSNGSVTTNITGGTTPYSYAWSNSAITANLNNIPAGTYTITVTDANNCTATTNTTVTQPNVLTLQLSPTNPLCFGATTGGITATVNGGTTPYSYNWNNGAQTQNISNVGAGNYTLIVTDNNNCFTQQTTSLTTPTALTLSGVVSNVTCNSNNSGAVTLTVNGGATPYAYSWSNSTNTQNLTGVNGGSYTVTVTDGNGCSVANNYIITQPLVLQSTILNTTNVTCNGLSNASINTNTTGGTSPYTFAWSNGLSTSNLSNIPAGNYVLTVTDANNCTTSLNTTITEPAVLTLQLSPTNPLCFGAATGSVNATINGGTIPYNYNWNNGAVSQNISNVSAGNYTLIVTDNNNCFTQQSVTISSPTELLVVETITNLSCNGDNSGAISLNVSGGVPNYNYSWSNALPNTANQTNLSAGNYSVTITDANQCSIVRSYIITEPALLSISVLQQEDVTCNGYTDGLIFTQTNGGTSPYSYVWNTGDISTSLYGVNGGNYSVTVRDLNSCTATLTATINEPAVLDFQFVPTNILCNGATTGSIASTVTGGNTPYFYLWNNNETTSSINNIPAGNYSLLVTDVKNCFVQQSIVITEPTALLVNASVSDLLCNADGSGAIDVNVSGGSPNYTYQWNGGQNSEDLSSLAAGNYTQTVTDGNGCSVVNNYVVTEPAVLTNTISNTINVTCNGLSNGSITTNQTGGSLPYTYLWSNGLVLQNLNNVPAGNYTLTLTDNNNCTAVATTTITEPAVLALQLNATNVLCFGATTGGITSTTTGGTTPYVYSWSNGTSSPNISNVPAGNYSLLVTDDNNCVVQQSIVITEPNALLVTATVSNLLCNADGSGAIDVNVSGGSPNYTYQWNGGQNSEDLSSLAAGNYTQTVTDGNGCSVVNNYVVTEPAVLTNTISNTINVTCNGLSNGSITTNQTGGSLPYTYLWSNGSVLQNLNNVPAANYTLTVTDNNNCTAIANTTITEPAVLALQLNTTDVLCFGATTGGITSTTTGGTTPYVYSWSNGTSSPNISNVPAGSYTLLVTDDNNCVVQASATISSPSALSLSFVSTNLLCFNDNSGSIVAQVNGGATPYSYSWSNNQNTNSINQLSAANFTVTVTDNNQCTITGGATLTQPSLLSIAIDNFNDISCNGFNDGFINTISNGGVQPYQYSWNDGIITPNRNNLSANNYTITLTDANACTASVSQNIIEPSSINITITNQDITCNGLNDGSASAVVTGGNAPYNYEWTNNATTANISNLGAGNYTLIITDVNNCLAFETVTIIQPAAITLSGSITNSTCNNNVGAVDVTVSGGTPNFSFNWSNNATTEDIINVASGNYTITVTDQNNCSLTQSFTVNAINGITATIAQLQDVSCAGDADGFIVTNISSGTLPFTFVWSNNVSTSQNAFNLSGGNYDVTITDANSCTLVVSASIAEPSPLAITVNAIAPQCNADTNGSISVNITGGTLPNTYLWSTGNTTNNISGLSSGTYTIVITDLNGCVLQENIPLTPNNNPQINFTKTDVLCGGDNNGSIDVTITSGTSPFVFNWSNLATTEDLNNLSGGDYTLIANDNNGCLDTAVITINEPIATALEVLTLNNLCFGNTDGIAFAVMTGGIPPYTFTWSLPITTSIEVADNLATGSYSVTVADSNNCSETANFAINEPNALTLQANGIINTSCYNSEDGNVILSVSGGSTPYEYSVSNNIYQNNAAFNNLSAEDYNAIVLDANGCSATTSFTIGSPLPFSVILPAAKVVFAGSNTILVPQVKGIDTSQVTFTWSPATYLSCTNCANPTMTPKEEITYTVTITDAFGCSDTASILILVRDDFEAFMPNVFTPNGDGINDFYGPVDFNAITKVDFRIFNRWGELVFYTDVPQSLWDGTYKSQPASEGVYVYTIFGSFSNNKSFKKKGSFTLAR